MSRPNLVEGHDCLEVVEGAIAQGVVNTAVTAVEITFDKNQLYTKLTPLTPKRLLYDPKMYLK